MIEIGTYLTERGITCLMPQPFEFRDQKNPCYFEEKWALLTPQERLRLSMQAEKKYLEKLDSAEIIYVVNPNGYVGTKRSV